MTSSSGVYLLVNLYRTPNASMYKTAAGPTCAVITIISSMGLFFTLSREPSILAFRICAAIIAMTPITEPHRPSKKLARNYFWSARFESLDKTLKEAVFTNLISH